MYLPVVVLLLRIVGKVREDHVLGVGEEVMLMRVRDELAVGVRVAWRGRFTHEKYFYFSFLYLII